MFGIRGCVEAVIRHWLQRYVISKQKRTGHRAMLRTLVERYSPKTETSKTSKRA